MVHQRNNAIGVFDSGLGGLTVVKEMINELPNERIVYFGDTARVPYGTKSREAIVRFSMENVAVLMRHRVKMVVVACNTSSSWALETLRKNYDVPIMGVIEPGARKAASATKNNVVGVIATSSTVRSQQYTKKIKKFSPAVRVVSQACPLFVPLAEEGWFSHAVTHEVAREYLRVMKQSKVDTLILGCTHYPLLKDVIGEVMGPWVTLVDSAREVALEVKRILLKHKLVRTELKPVRHAFLVSDEPNHFRRLAGRFLGHEIKHVERCDV